jgi:hypothetical protein
MFSSTKAGVAHTGFRHVGRLLQAAGHEFDDPAEACAPPRIAPAVAMTWAFRSVALCVLLAGCSPRADRAPTTTPLVPTMVGDRAAHTASTLGDGRVLIAGGCVTDGCTTATADTFVVSSDGTAVALGRPMSMARDGHTANVLANGQVIVVGGYPGEGAGVLDSVEVLDPSADTPKELLRLAQGRGGHASALLGVDRVVVIGGWVGPQTSTRTVEIIDPATGRVDRAADLPWAADALDAVGLPDGRVLVTGGQSAPDVPTNAAAIYDPMVDRWTQVAPMKTRRYKHFSVLLRDGRVLVMGGDTGNRNLTRTTEIFDPKTLRFTPGPDLREPRYKFSGGAVALADGRIVVAGGGASTEVLDVKTGHSRTIRDRSRVRSFATLNLLGSGDLLVLGGYDEEINLTRTSFVIAQAELRR